MMANDPTTNPSADEAESADEPAAQDIPNGPNRKPIDFKVVEALASKGCSDQEIAIFCNVSEATIKVRARGSLNRGRSSLKLSLRQKQVELAKGGNVVMLIWLGKQMLNQSDRVEHRPITDAEDLNRLSDSELAAVAAGKPLRVVKSA